MSTHDYFRQLSALAEIGEISEKEHAELEMHLRDCSECRQAAEEYREILFDWLPLKPIPDAEVTGDLRTPARSFRPGLPWIVPIAAAFILAIALSVAWNARLAKESAHLKQALNVARAESASLVNNLQDKNKKIQGLEKSLADQSQRESAPADRKPSAESIALQQARVRLADLEAERDQIRSAHSSDREELEKLSRDLDQARATQRGEQKRSSDLEARVRELESEVGRREARIKGLTSRLAFLDARIKGESDQKSGPSGMLDRIIHDPSLRVINVYAVSNKSRQPNAFCRILKVADAPPVIYAYRLTTGDFGASDDRRHFQVWGMKLSIEPDSLGLISPTQTSGASVRLGELRKDATSSDRWMLQIPDSEALNGVRYLLITEGPPRPDSAVPPVFWGLLAGAVN